MTEICGDNCTEVTREEAEAIGHHKFVIFASGAYGIKHYEALAETMIQLWNDLREQGGGLHVRRSPEIERDNGRFGWRNWVGRQKIKMSFRVAPKNGQPFKPTEKVKPEGERIKYFWGLFK